MAAPVKQKLIVEIIPSAHQPASGKSADQAIRAIARILGRQIAREQFRKQAEASVRNVNRAGTTELPHEPPSPVGNEP